MIPKERALAPTAARRIGPVEEPDRADERSRMVEYDLAEALRQGRSVSSGVTSNGPSTSARPSAVVTSSASVAVANGTKYLWPFNAPVRDVRRLLGLTGVRRVPPRDGGDLLAGGDRADELVLPTGGGECRSRELHVEERPGRQARPASSQTIASSIGPRP